MRQNGSRRHFLKLGASATAAGLLPLNLRQALAIPAHNRTGTIQDVEHVVILMQENRSFDHYFGTLRGVRGYDDPRAEHQPDGTSIFAQRNEQGKAILPFRFEVAHTSSACLKSLDHSWKGSQRAWDDWNIWVPRKTPMTMGYFTRAEIPYYYALADAFTICDAYHASIFGPTNPNRLFLFSGTSGLAVGNRGKQAIENVDDGNWSADIAHDRPDFTPFNWTTYPERLQKAGVSWKVYQEYDNFGDNPLASFAAFRGVAQNSWQYRNARHIVEGSNAKNMQTSEGRFLVEAFEHDVATGRLPQVSWIVPPSALSEHPDAPPGYGEHLISQLMDVFVRHPDVWSKTVFILNYDENDGFFDHVPPPVPALDPTAGGGTVSTQGEAYGAEPVGLGPRVPALMISPWSKGGWVNSQVFDHTSVLRFLEARFGVEAPYITPWRKAVCGDLTSAFDFKNPDARWTSDLPDTARYRSQTELSCKLPPPVIPAEQTMPIQEAGQRLSRALPYVLHADLVERPDRAVRLAISGPQGATFRLRDDGGTRHYTLDAGHELLIPVAGSVSITAPNGFYRFFHESAAIPIRLTEHREKDIVGLLMKPPTKVIVRNHYADQSTHFAKSEGPLTHSVAVASADHWYDLSIIDEASGEVIVRLAGHMETGRPSRSDPRIGLNAGENA